MSYDVNIKRHGLWTLFDLKGQPDQITGWVGETLPNLPDRPNSYTTRDDLALYYIGRNHWILRAPIEREDALNEVLKPERCPADISIVRVSDTTTFFSITGQDVADVMAVATPLDLHASVFAEDSVTYTEVFGLKALVLRCEGGIEFGVEQSFGNMVDDYLVRTIA